MFVEPPNIPHWLLLQPLSAHGDVDSLTPCVMMVTREIFPVFHRWRYSSVKSREIIGQLCLQVFHKILNLLGKSHAPSAHTSVITWSMRRTISVLLEVVCMVLIYAQYCDSWLSTGS